MMAAPAAVRQAAQIGVEAVYGDGATVTKRLGSFGLSKSRQFEVGSVRPQGSLANTKSWISREWSEFSVEGGVASYDEMDYLLQSVLKKQSATTPVGATLARQRVYTPGNWSADAFQSYSVEAGDIARNRGGKARGAFFQEWGISVGATSETVELSGSMMGQKIDEASGMTPNIPSSDFTPILPGHFKAYFALDPGDLGTASDIEIDKAMSLGFTVGDRRAPVWYIGRIDSGFADTVETVPSFEIPMTLADEEAPLDDLIGYAREGRNIFMRLEATGPEIEPGVPHKLTIDFAGSLSEGPSDEEEDDVQVVNLSYTCQFDADWGKFLEVTTQNSLAAL